MNIGFALVILTCFLIFLPVAEVKRRQVINELAHAKEIMEQNCYIILYAINDFVILERMFHIQPRKKVPLNHHLTLCLDSYLLSDIYTIRSPRCAAMDTRLVKRVHCFYSTDSNQADQVTVNKFPQWVYGAKSGNESSLPKPIIRSRQASLNSDTVHN
ncbi:MAG: hypothetical protein CMH49_01775 [Myxococcales bacterium]|nr:hypothetical protein [Myxococcales bacterium]